MRTRPRTAAAALAVVALAALPAAARAQGSGGVAAPVAVPAAPVEIATGGGVQLTTPPDATVRQPLLVHGSADPAVAGHQVKLQLQDPTSLTWKKVTGARVNPDGTFTERWKPRRTGQFALRAVLQGAST